MAIVFVVVMFIMFMLVMFFFIRMIIVILMIFVVTVMFVVIMVRVAVIMFIVAFVCVVVMICIMVMVFMIIVMLVVMTGIILWWWSNWITATLGDDLAASVGVNAKRESFYLAALLAILVGLALKIVGALLITALLIIPAATARRFTSTPEMMAILSVGFGSAASAIGLWAAYIFDWPAGPSMVATAAVLFGISQLRNAV